MRFQEFYGRQRLFEMNVANGDALAQQIAQVFDYDVKAKGLRVDKGVRDTLLKRLLKSCINDEAGLLVHADVAEVGETAPTIQIARKIGANISRDDVFKAATRFMKFYHEKIVPLEQAGVFATV